MSQLSDVHQAQALPGVIASQAQVQNQNLVHGSAAAGQNVQHAKAAEEENPLSRATSVTDFLGWSMSEEAAFSSRSRWMN